MKKDWKEETEKHKKELKKLKNRYEILELYSKKLEDKLNLLDREKRILLEDAVKKTHHTRKKLMKDKELKSREILIKQMQHRLGEQKKLLGSYHHKFSNITELKNIKSENRIPVILIDNFDRSEILSAKKRFGIKDQIVYFKNANFSKAALRSLISANARFICGEIDPEIKEMLKKAGINHINTEVRFHNFYGSIPLEELKRLEKRSFLKYFR